MTKVKREAARIVVPNFLAALPLKADFDRLDANVRHEVECSSPAF